MADSGAPKEGDCVEVFGLASEGGEDLNGQRGIVTGAVLGDGNLQVRTSPEKLVGLKPENLRKVTITVGERLAILGLGQAAEGEAAPGGEAPKRSASRSSSSSSSSRSRSRSRSPAREPEFQVGWQVEIAGLSSAAGMELNGRTGTVLKKLPGEGSCRYEVCLGKDQFVSLKPTNMVPVMMESSPTAAVDAKAAPPAPKKPEEKKVSSGSLAGLLGMGRGPEKVEEKKPEVWQPVFARNASADQQTITSEHRLTEDQVELLKCVEKNSDKVEDEQMLLRQKIEAELRSQGAYVEEMAEELFKQQWEEYQLQKLLRPQDSSYSDLLKPSPSASPKARSRSRSQSRSSSSSSSSSSSAKGKEGAEAPKG